MEKKLAIVASGGGMKCSYGAGVVVALGKFFEVRPDIFVAGSGGSGGLSFYAAEQYDSIQNIWTNLITGKRFIDKLRLSKIADVDYLIDDVFKLQDPLNAEVVVNSGIDCRIAVTNAKTGKVEHFSPLEEDVFELMRASMAMPIVYGKKIPLNGNLYHDSYASSFLGLNLEKAISLGAKKIIAINNSRFGSIDRRIFKLWSKFQGKNFDLGNSSEMERSERFKAPSDVETLVLEPREELGITSFDADEKRVRRAFFRGYEETIANKRLKGFLKN